MRLASLSKKFERGTKITTVKDSVILLRFMRENLVKKSTLMPIILVFSLFVNIYQYKNSISGQSKNMKLVKDKVRMKKSSIKKHEVIPAKEKKHNLKGIKNSFLETEKRDYSDLQETKIENKNYINADEVEKAQEAWHRKASDFFTVELGLDGQTIEEFFQLNKDREKELNEFMRSRINHNGGDQFFYTLEDIVNENKINEKYLEKVKSMLGPGNYENYKVFRNQYNKKIIESGEGFYLIEI